MLIILLFAVLQNPVPGRGIVRQDQKGQSQRAEQQTNTDQRGTEQSPFVVKELPTPKTDTETAQEAKDREDKTANDRSLVKFTLYLVIATFVLAAIGLLQLFVFGDQARQLRGTVKAASDQSDAMERSIREAARLATAMEHVSREIAVSAAAATESVATVKERTAMQLRAYLTFVIDAGTFQERSKNLRFEARPRLVNTGHTPATKVCFSAKAAILPAPLPQDFDTTLPLAPSGLSATLGAQQFAIAGASVDGYCPDAEVEAIKTGNGKCLYIWGIVTYEDVFGEIHETKFCHSVMWYSNGQIYGFYIPGLNDAT